MSRFASLSAALLIACSSPVEGEVCLQTESYTTVASGLLEKYKAFLGLQISYLEDHNGQSLAVTEDELSPELAKFTEEREGKRLLRVSRYSYALASPALQSRMQEEVLAYMGAVTAYRPLVDMQKSSLLDKQLLLPGLSIPPYRNESTVQVEHFLSSFVQRWAYQNSGQVGPNCLYSAIASINEGWVEPRFMPENEFLDLLKQSFREVNSPDKFGDLLVVFDSNGNPDHAATFVGRSQTDERIFFTKNGRTAGHYVFMDLKTLVGDEFMYDGGIVRFFRQTRPF